MAERQAGFTRKRLASIPKAMAERQAGSTRKRLASTPKAMAERDKAAQPEASATGQL